jgi:hypothetical protein
VTKHHAEEIPRNRSIIPLVDGKNRRHSGQRARKKSARSSRRSCGLHRINAAGQFGAESNSVMRTFVVDQTTTSKLGFDLMLGASEVITQKKAALLVGSGFQKEELIYLKPIQPFWPELLG